MDESLIDEGVEEYAALGSGVEEVELYSTKEMIQFSFVDFRSKGVLL